MTDQPPAPVERATLASGHVRRQMADRISLARLQQSRWDLPGALDTLARVIEESRDAGIEGVTVLTARRMHAEIHLDLGHTERAYALAAELFDDCAAQLGPDHPATIRSCVLLAAVHHHLGDAQTAEALCRQIVGTADSRAQPARRAVLLAHVHLALITADRGDRPAAIESLTNTLNQFRDHYGDHDLDTVRITAELAELHRSVGDTAAGRRLLTRAHHDARFRLGGAHPFTTGLEHHLARLEPPMPGNGEGPEPVRDWADPPSRRDRPRSGRQRLRLGWPLRRRPARTADQTAIGPPPDEAAIGSAVDRTAIGPALDEAVFGSTLDEAAIGSALDRAAIGPPPDEAAIEPAPGGAAADPTVPAQSVPDSPAADRPPPAMVVAEPIPPWLPRQRQEWAPQSPDVEQPDGAPPWELESSVRLPEVASPWDFDEPPVRRSEGLEPAKSPTASYRGAAASGAQPEWSTGGRAGQRSRWTPPEVSRVRLPTRSRGPVRPRHTAAAVRRIGRRARWPVIAVASTVLGALLAVVAVHEAGRVLSSVGGGAATTTGSAPGGTVTTGGVVLTLLPDADELTVTWTDPSNGRATPIVSLATATGQTVVTTTLPPGTTSYARHGLDPLLDYCVLLALYLTPDDTSAVGTRACTHRAPPDPSPGR